MMNADKNWTILNNDSPTSLIDSIQQTCSLESNTHLKSPLLAIKLMGINGNISSQLSICFIEDLIPMNGCRRLSTVARNEFIRLMTIIFKSHYYHFSPHSIEKKHKIVFVFFRKRRSLHA